MCAAARSTEHDRRVQDGQVARPPRVAAGELGDPVQPVPQGVRVHEQAAGGRFECARRGPGRRPAFPAAAWPPRPAGVNARPQLPRGLRSPASTRSTSEVVAPAGRGAAGHAQRRRSPASASAADVDRPGDSPVATGPRTIGPVAEDSSARPGRRRADVVAGRRRSAPAGAPCTPASALRPPARAHSATSATVGACSPGGPVRPRRPRSGRRPSRGPRPATPATRVLAPDDAVDDRRFDPGVPGAAGLGRGRVHRGGGKGDLPAVTQQRVPQRGRSAGSWPSGGCAPPRPRSPPGPVRPSGAATPPGAGRGARCRTPVGEPQVASGP